ncbi:MAG TPA: Ig-like domain-containing protein [Chitinophagaceae bacterium]|nr:Ig-like domain-containing protein [Chitinophagaceae bacterium]
MKLKRIIPAVVLISLILVNVIFDSGCANIIPPAGGPKDTIAPVLLDANPNDSTLNFSGSRITFTFDEFIDIQNVYENLIVSPLPKVNPAVDFKLKTLTVRIKDTLEPNTTYTLNFGNSVKDYTEGNVFKDFSYTFSTGSYLDSLEIKGNVILAENGKIDTTLIVMLHANGDDSAVIKEKPRYVTRLDGKGNFVFNNLPVKTFFIYALKDEGNSRRYLNDKQFFAFADSAVNTAQQNNPITLYAFSATKATQQTTVPSSPGISPKNRKTEAQSEKRLRYMTNLTNGQQDLLSDFEISFEEPLKAFDTTKINLYTDSVYNKESNYKWEIDSSRKKITLSCQWKENTFYHLIMEKDFAVDSTGKMLLKSDTLNFATKRLADYGTLRLRLRNLDISKNPVLQFVQNETIYKSFPLSSEEFNQKLFPPGEYQLRILFDDNKNGVWDPGEFFGKHKQPEIVKPVDRKINVKSNWQNEIEIVL